MRAVRHVMGTPVTIDVRDAGVDAAVLDAAFADLWSVDELFSTQRDRRLGSAPGSAVGWIRPGS